MTAGRSMTRLVEELPMELATGQVALCSALSSSECELMVDGLLPAGRTVSATLRTAEEGAISLELTPLSEARQGRTGLLQQIDLRPASSQDERALASMMLRLRKDAHIALCAHEDVESEGVTAGWDRVDLPHEALPELDAETIDLSTVLLGKPMRLPLLISGMTGGSRRGAAINRTLAAVAQQTGIGMGVGSQRRMLDDPDLTATYEVRDIAPDILLLANVGAVQLNYSVTADQCAHLVEAIGADALCLHLNALQEMIQPEGERNFAGLWAHVAHVCEVVPVPVLLKETGCGVDADLTRRALEAGCVGVDVAGVGGTSWARVETLRQADRRGREVGETFRDWGIPTVDAVADARSVGDRHVVVGSGGVRNGLHMAKAIALGADCCGMALPFLRAALESEARGLELIARLAEELRVAMFCSSASDLRALRRLGDQPAEGDQDG